MNKKILVAAVGIALAGGLLYFARNAKQPPKQHTQGLIQTKVPVIETICVEKIQNLSHQPVNMEGVDEELVTQLQTVGFRSSRKISESAGRACDATVNAELVEISGRTRKTARVDYRLTLAKGEQAPRISASVEGKSRDHSSSKLESNFRPMALVAAQKPDKAVAEREAISAAIAQQAYQIKDAYDHGLKPWLRLKPEE
jgi:hypothetical protein